MKTYKAKYKKKRTQKPIDTLRYTDSDKETLNEKIPKFNLETSKANRDLHLIAKDLAKEINITSNYIHKLNQITNRKIIVVSIEEKRNIYTKILKNTNKMKIVSMYFPSTNIIENLKIALNKLNENTGKENPLFLFIDIILDAKAPVTNRNHNKKTTNNIESTKNNFIKNILENENKIVKIINYNLEKDEKKNNNDYLPKFTKKELNETDAILFSSSKKILDLNKKWKTSPSENKKEIQLIDFEKLVLWHLDKIKTRTKK
jgi:hypothetical protein